MKKLTAILVSCLLLVASFEYLPKSIVNIQNDSTVVVKMKLMDIETGRQGIGTCSGTYITPNEILTAAHCTGIDDLIVKKMWIKKNGKSADAYVILADHNLDLALLYTNLKGIPVKIATSVRQGEKLIILGNPLGLEQVMTSGIVSKANFKFTKTFKNGKFFITDASVLPGNSGGGVFNSRGQLMGVVSMSTALLGNFGMVGLGIIVDSDTIRKFLKQG